jgi:guanylate kinase
MSCLIVVSGPSGVGKATLSKELLKRRKDIVLSVSATTRKPRPGEIHGQDYFFMKKNDFLNKIQLDYFVEWAQVHDNYYGTPFSSVSDKLESKCHVLLEIDVQGGMRVKKLYGDRCMLFFILPPSFNELKKRLQNRASESQEEIEQRLKTARLELLRQDEYDYTIINDEIDRAVNQILDILNGRLCFEKGKPDNN